MNWAHIHIALNHVPVIGVIFGILLLLYAIVKKSEELEKVVLGIFFIVAVVAILVFFTGGGAEEAVEHLPGVSESIIERHEESALISLIIISFLGAMSLVGLLLLRKSNSIPGWFMTSLLILSVISGGLVARTANLGGQVHHPEIRKEFRSSKSDDVRERIGKEIQQERQKDREDD